MATTILAKKATTDTPMAKSDDQHTQLAADPTIPQFPQESSYGTTTPNTTLSASSTSAFGTPSAGGFGLPSSFGAPAAVANGSPPSTSNMGSIGSSNMNVSLGNQPVLTGAGANAAQDASILIKNTNDDFINKKWRPLMAFVYMLTCTCDFVIFPILWSLLQAMSKGSVTMQWQPLTLQGAGLYHIAMGAVLGVAAYGRTKEKIEGKA